MIKGIIALLVLLSFTAQADSSLPSELHYKTPAGYLTITNKPCDLKFQSQVQYEYSANSTSIEPGKGLVNHPGCWTLDGFAVDGRLVNTVNVYYPEINQTAVYKLSVFKKNKEETF